MPVLVGSPESFPAEAAKSSSRVGGQSVQAVGSHANVTWELRVQVYTAASRPSRTGCLWLQILRTFPLSKARSCIFRKVLLGNGQPLAVLVLQIRHYGLSNYGLQVPPILACLLRVPEGPAPLALSAGRAW